MAGEPPPAGAGRGEPPAAPPAVLDRSALERVLARAAELQASEVDTGEMMTEEQLVELGREVGLSPQHMRQALAEERTRVLVRPEPGVAARLFGVARVYAARALPGRPEIILGQLDEWMEREECLVVKRRFPDRMLWEPRRGFWADIKRGMRIGGRSYQLARAREVGATAVGVDGERTLVRLEADVGNDRASRVGIGSAIAGVGLAAAGAMVAIDVLPLIALLPSLGGLAAGYGLARTHEGVAARTQLALEQVLDQLEHRPGPRAPSLLESALNAARLIR